MKQVFFITIILWLSLAVYSQDMDLKAIEDLKESVKKTAESDLTPAEKEKKNKLWINKAINAVDTAKSHYVSTYQFEKSKRASDILAQLKEGKVEIEIKAEETVEKKEEVAKPKKATVAEAHLNKLFPEGLVDAAGKPYNLSNLNGKVFGLYFSAHWCGPCRRFTPTLVKLRDENNTDFEVIFVSSDNSQSDKEKYISEAGMKWPSVKLNGENDKAISSKFKVSGIPHLIIFSKSGEVITENGRSEISEDAIKKWAKEK